MSCWQQDSLLLTGPGIYPQVYHRTLCPAVLFVRESNKKQRRGRIISNFISYLYQPSDNIAMWSPFLHPSKKKSLFFPLQFGSEENISGNSIERRVYILIYFENWQGAPCSYRQSRNRMMNTFIIVNITPICKRQFRGYIYACPHQKGPPYHFTWALIWKKSLLLTALFWKLPGYPLFPHR